MMEKALGQVLLLCLVLATIGLCAVPAAAAPAEGGVLVPAATAPEEEDPRALALQMLSLTNKERAEKGLAELVWSEDVYACAVVRAAEIAVNYGHIRPGDREFYTVRDELGYTFGKMAENIAGGHESPQEVITAWVRSEGHRANMLSESYTLCGFATATDDAGRRYWVQLFAKD